MSLELSSLNDNGTNLYFLFRYLKDGRQIRGYSFRSFQMDRFRIPDGPIVVSSTEVISGPASVDSVPDREEEVVFMSIHESDPTWALPTQTVKLLFRGFHFWEATVHLDRAIGGPIRLDGTWTRTF